MIDSELEIEANDFAIFFLAPTCVLKRAHINKAKEIAHNTNLDERSAAIVAHNIANEHYELSEYEKVLCDCFSRFIREHAHRKCSLVISIFSTLIVLIACALFIYLPLHYGNNANTSQQRVVPTPTTVQQMTTKSEPTLSSREQTDMVVITKTGTKYHRTDCQHVENITNTFTITKAEALARNYGPCSTCNP